MSVKCLHVHSKKFVLLVPVDFRRRGCVFEIRMITDHMSNFWLTNNYMVITYEKMDIIKRLSLVKSQGITTTESLVSFSSSSV